MSDQTDPVVDIHLTQVIQGPRRAKKKAKVKRAAPARKVVQIPTVPEDTVLGGLSATECPYDCNAEGCVISGRNFCAHPNKGGMQSVMQGDGEAVKRYNKARKLLAHQALDRKP